MSADREAAIRDLSEWANTPHQNLGFSERQMQVQALLAELAAARTMVNAYSLRVTEMEAREAKLREALRWYADPRNRQSPSLARAALADGEGET